MPSDNEAQEQKQLELLRAIRGMRNPPDRLRVEEKCRLFLLDPARFTPGFPDRVMRELREKRLFRQMADFAERSLQDGTADPLTAVYYGQALIEEGRIGAAIAVLEPHATARPVQNEANGLLGRAYKQLYVGNPRLTDADRAIQLLKALDHYSRVPEPYERVNLCALLVRAAADGIDTHGDYGEPKAIARELIDGIQCKRPRDTWDNALAAEASLALHKPPADVFEWLEQYTVRRDVDAFELAGTLRQFEEVWQLDRMTEFRPALNLLRLGLLDREGGAFDVSPEAIPAISENGAFGETDAFAPIHSPAWLKQGLETAAGVGRIESPEGVAGTGFLVAGADLGARYKGSFVFLTESRLTLGADPKELTVRFLAGDTAEYPVDALLWASPPGALGVAALRLTGVAPTHPVCRLSKDDIRTDKRHRVCVAGSPEGGGSKFALDNNNIVQTAETAVYYTAISKSAAPGSPVFDESWEVVAMHRGIGSGRLDDGTPFTANQGVPMSAIVPHTMQGQDTAENN